MYHLEAKYIKYINAECCFETQALEQGKFGFMPGFYYSVSNPGLGDHEPSD